MTNVPPLDEQHLEICKKYTDRDMKGRLIASWYKDDKGVWHNNTEEMKEKERLEELLHKAKREHSKLLEQIDNRR